MNQQYEAAEASDIIRHSLVLLGVNTYKYPLPLHLQLLPHLSQSYISHIR